MVKKLAKGLSLIAFSTMIRWRPTGLNVGQARLFIERFPSEFRLGAIPKVVLPCQGGRAFFCPDGRLPCPFLSTCNALRMLEKNKADQSQGAQASLQGDPQAWKDIDRVLDRAFKLSGWSFRIT